MGGVSVEWYHACNGCDHARYNDDLIEMENNMIVEIVIVVVVNGEKEFKYLFELIFFCAVVVVVAVVDKRYIKYWL